MVEWTYTAWRNWLPSVFGWLQHVSMQTTQHLVEGACHLIPLEWDKEKKELAWPGEMPQALQEALSKELMLQGIKDKPSAPLLLHIQHITYLLVPLTLLKVSVVQKWRQAGLDAARVLGSRNFNHLVFLGGSSSKILDFFFGYTQGLYRQESFKADDTDKPIFPKEVTFYGEVQPRDYEKTVALALGSLFAKTLQDAPANALTPEAMAYIAEDIAKDAGLKCTIKGRQEMMALGMGAFCGVAKGSPLDPKLIVIEVPGSSSQETIAFVGKGLTFDTGGYCLKPGLGMPDMKYDVSGGVAVLAAAFVLGRLKPRANLVCAIGAVENMLSGDAIRPGDVVRAMNGKTIEIGNTDAEGRLVLADVLHYVISHHQPSVVIDIATLTGAVQVALGSLGCGLFSNHDGLSAHVKAAAQAQGEPMWPLPIWPELGKELRSETADLQNIASPHVKAGSLVAAAFLKEFVGTTPWVHLDIAGTGWSCKATGYNTQGGSAFGLATLVEFALPEAATPLPT